VVRNADRANTYSGGTSNARDRRADASGHPRGWRPCSAARDARAAGVDLGDVDVEQETGRGELGLDGTLLRCVPALIMAAANFGTDDNVASTTLISPRSWRGDVRVSALAVFLRKLLGDRQLPA